MKKLLIILNTIAFATATCITHAQQLDEFPRKSVRMIVPLAPGGGSDIVGRILATGLSEKWNQNVIVDNRPGAGGNIGSSIVAKSYPDGYTQLLTSSTLAISGALIKNNEFDVKTAFAPVSLIANQPSVVLVNNQFSASTFREFLTQLKNNPGKFNFGSAGVGTASHLANELFLVKTNTQATHVPYKSAGVAATGLLRGELHFMVTNLATAFPLIQNNRARALAVTSKHRQKSLPDVPTVAEFSLPDFEYTTWYGLLVSAKTPRSLLEKINQDVVNVVRQDAIKNRLEQQGLIVIASSAADFNMQLKTEIQNWIEVVQTAGIKPN